MSKLSKGQSLFELIIALGVSVIILTALVSVSITSVSNTTSSRTNSQANRYAQEAFEWVRGQRDNYTSWSDFKTNRADNDWCIIASPPVWPGSSGACGSCANITGTNFQRCVSITSVSDDSVNTTVVVTWTDAKGSHEVRYSSRLTNWNI